MTTTWPWICKQFAGMSAKCSLLQPRETLYSFKETKYLTTTEINLDSGRVCQGCQKRKHFWFHHEAGSNRQICTFLNWFPKFDFLNNFTAKTCPVRWGSQDRHNQIKRQQGLLSFHSWIKQPKGLWRCRHRHDKWRYSAASECAHRGTAA